jgi:hypothetical protein
MPFKKKVKKSFITPLQGGRLFGKLCGVPRVGDFSRTKTKQGQDKMSTANFKSMKDFPLIVAKDEYCKVCPECGCTQVSDAAKCDECGCNLSGVDSVYDEWTMDDMVRNMEAKAKELNEYLTFYTVSVESGYYSGLQFYVDEKYCDVEDMDNEDARMEFGMCRSKMLRKYNSEGNWLRRELRKAKDELGLVELGVTARFSNGEVWYTEIKPEMPKWAALKVAVNAA